MSAENSISINKNKKKFKPKLGKRKRISEEISTSHEEQEPARANEPPKSVKRKHIGEESDKNQQESARTNEPSANTIQPIEQDYLETQMPPPELIQELTHLYPKAVQKVTKRFKCAPPKDYIPPDLPTAEDRRKQSDIAQESLLSETQKQIQEIKRKREEREQTNDLTESASAPQVKLVKGKIVLDEDTLEVSRSDPNYKDIVTDILIENQEVRLKSPWTPLETQVFYDGLSIYGLDFRMIASTLVGRTRESVFLKYHREEARYPEKVAKYMFNKKPAGNV
ncbi:hypothetical protein EDC94DRAFT_610295 [Helicostylum pulchrum]|nr:hypothetical protein EDC94DRAFT_610295 [Helicostylum pulchrum]